MTMHDHYNAPPPEHLGRVAFGAWRNANTIRPYKWWFQSQFA
ncbi:hypothetical protein [Okeania sp. SIO2B3]|nr:hypothetical protein [Okeania sp. SIO2B3]